MSSLVERLLAKKLFPYVEGGNTIERVGYVNPDGPEAANEIERLERQFAELQESWFYLHKWVERGLFCKSVTPTEALECIAHHPTAPWKNGRWDVDHKDYAEAFYGKFPKAREALSLHKGGRDGD